MHLIRLGILSFRSLNLTLPVFIMRKSYGLSINQFLSPGWHRHHSVQNANWLSRPIVRNLMILLLCSASMSLQATPFQISLVVNTDWTYQYNRCERWRGPYTSESEAITAGMNDFYYPPCQPYMTDPKAWGTVENPTYGPCGSTNLYPSPFSAINQATINRTVVVSFLHGN